MLYYRKYELGPEYDWVVLIHGAGASSVMWYKQIRVYRKHFNVISVDLRGHGRSHDGDAVKYPHDYTFRQISQDVIETLDYLHIDKAHFVGISLGTIIIRNISDMQPGRVLSMVLAGAVIRLNRPSKLFMYLISLFTRFVPYMWLYTIFAWVLMPLPKHQQSRMLLINEAKKVCQKEFVRWFKLTKEVNPLLKLFEEKGSEVPTLYIMGSEDYMFLLPVQLVAQKQKAVQLSIIENCGHICNVSHAEQFNRLSLSFLENNRSLTHS